MNWLGRPASRRPIVALASRQNGGAGIELALISPLLLILLTGVAEIGLAAFQAMQVQASVEAGTLYATRYGGANIAAINQAIVNGTGTAGITSSAAVFCGCPAAAGVVGQGSDCATACADGKAPGQYVRLTAALTHQKIMPFLNLPLPAILTAAATVRVQ